MTTLTTVLAHPAISRITTSRAAQWLVNPHCQVTDQQLRAAVAGRTALVTGASYGVGEATARRLAAAGARVLLVARTRDALAATADRISAAGGTAFAYPTDLADPAQVAALTAEVQDQHGPVDVVVNNAGKSIRRSIAESYDRFHDFQRTIDVNYLGPVQLMLGLLPAMRERRRGHLVNVSTVGARIPPGPRWAAYQSSKIAYDVFFRATASEAAADRVTATTIYLGLVRTRMSAPTAIFDHLPGMTPDQAADLVAAAVVQRPAKISPWWADAADTAFGPGRALWERAVARLYRAGREARR